MRLRDFMRCVSSLLFVRHLNESNNVLPLIELK